MREGVLLGERKRMEKYTGGVPIWVGRPSRTKKKKNKAKLNLGETAKGFGFIE